MTHQQNLDKSYRREFSIMVAGFSSISNETQATLSLTTHMHNKIKEYTLGRLT